MYINDVTYEIRGAIFEVFKLMGPGLLETVYESALALELITRGLYVQRQVPIPVHYKGQLLDVAFKIDILVETDVIIELKSVETLSRLHKKQVINYLNLAGLSTAFLVNFNVEKLIDKESLVRIVN